MHVRAGVLKMAITHDQHLRIVFAAAPLGKTEEQ